VAAAPPFQRNVPARLRGTRIPLGDFSDSAYPYRVEPVRRAVIDIGTNSVKLLVADVLGHDVRPVWEGSKQTRLGRGFYQAHILLPEAISATADAVADFSSSARTHGAVTVRAIATSAARDALNAYELKQAVHSRTGLQVQIISGEQEAEWAFQGVATDPRFSSNPLLLLEVGGGSCQFILGHAGDHPVRHSFPMGAVRLLERTPHSDPPTSAEFESCREHIVGFLRDQVQPVIEPALKSEARGDGSLQFVATGGTASVLGCIEAELTHFDRDRLESVRLTRERLAWQVRRLWNLTLEERKQIAGLPANRADIILTGGAIYSGAMDYFTLPELCVSTRGLRYAALM